MPLLTDESRYKLLKLLEQNPELNQRELAKAMDVSVGKINYCLKALVDKGSIKASRFRQSENKKSYAYLLTPKGIEEKARVTLRFLKQKQTEYENLLQELQELREEAGQIVIAEKGND